MTEKHNGCMLCPRACGAERANGEVGICGVGGEKILGARAALHMWEEPCISGQNGSGTVFFSGCPLRCVYCQNYEIAHAKRGTEDIAKRYSKASDYPVIAKRALDEMVRQCGEAKFDDRGMMKKGVIVRHLLLPGHLKNAKDVVQYIYGRFGNQVYISLMNQYTPLPQVKAYPEIDRKVTEEEYEELIEYAVQIGVEHGFIQEGETAKESFIPKFDNEGGKEGLDAIHDTTLSGRF